MPTLSRKTANKKKYLEKSMLREANICNWVAVPMCIRVGWRERKGERGRDRERERERGRDREGGIGSMCQVSLKDNRKEESKRDK